jgi:hypothetical protein
MNNITAAESEVTRLETLVAEAARDRRELLNPPPQSAPPPSGP